MESQVFAENNQINSSPCSERSPPKCVRIAEELARLIKIYDLQERDVNLRRPRVLLALPVYLHEDASNFVKTCTWLELPKTNESVLAADARAQPPEVHRHRGSRSASSGREGLLLRRQPVLVILLMLPSSALRASLSSWRMNTRQLSHKSG
ncbi:hypothetical protein OJAV_G00006360 [Oryzias javanicus]|uniref:Uncharacterized protein n=1 Tax=Oryzias javanicus TaxID=123683 RepID=A0A3S2PHW4_ORYJA|nr:hypothetical protein OJAV_G00006360 [Oryzias javanicus]